MYLAKHDIKRESKWNDDNDVWIQKKSWNKRLHWPGTERCTHLPERNKLQKQLKGEIENHLRNTIINQSDPNILTAGNFYKEESTAVIQKKLPVKETLKAIWIATSFRTALTYKKK